MTIRATDLLAQIALEDPEFAALSDELEDAHILATNVLRFRVERDMSQADLAAKAGIRQPRIAEIESGEANPRLKTIRRIAAALGVRSGDLLREYQVEEVAAETSPAGAVLRYATRPVHLRIEGETEVFRFDEFERILAVARQNESMNVRLGMSA